jgi:hypothetical protein
MCVLKEKSIKIFPKTEKRMLAYAVYMYLAQPNSVLQLTQHWVSNPQAQRPNTNSVCELPAHLHSSSRSNSPQFPGGGTSVGCFGWKDGRRMKGVDDGRELDKRHSPDFWSEWGIHPPFNAAAGLRSIKFMNNLLLTGWSKADKWLLAIFNLFLMARLWRIDSGFAGDWPLVRNHWLMTGHPSSIGHRRPFTGWRKSSKKTSDDQFSKIV